MILMRMFCLCVNLYPLAAYKKELELNRKQPKPKAAKADAGCLLGCYEDAKATEKGREGGEAEIYRPVYHVIDTTAVAAGQE